MWARPAGDGSAQRGLVRALLARGGLDTRLVEIRTRAWAVLLFDGETHRIVLLLPEAAAARFAEGIEEAEFALPSHILADIAIVARESSDGTTRLAIEALTITEA